MRGEKEKEKGEEEEGGRGGEKEGEGGREREGGEVEQSGERRKWRNKVQGVHNSD